MGWLIRPRNDTFVLTDGSHACHRSKRKGSRETAYNEKMRREPLQESPTLGF